MSDFDRPWAKGLRNLILKRLQQGGPTTTQNLAALCEVSEGAVAPRMSELEAQGKVRDSGLRAHSVSGRGRKLKIWEAVQ